MSDFQRNDGRESWEIHTTTMGNTIKTKVFDMPPSYESLTYDIAIKKWNSIISKTSKSYENWISKDFLLKRLWNWASGERKSETEQNNLEKG